MFSRRTIACLLLCFTVLWGGAAVAGPFTPGDVVVLQVNQGAVTNPTATTAPVALLEYSPNGVLVQTIDVTGLAAGAGNNFSLTGTSQFEGFLSRSGDSSVLTLAGYNTAVGSANLANYQGVIARIDSTGNVDFTTTGTSVFNGGAGNPINGASSSDGSRFWVSAGSSYGTTTPGSNTAINWNQTDNTTSFGSIRVINGQLYVTNGSGPASVSQVSPALPTGSSTNSPVASFFSVGNEFVLLNRNGGAGPDTLYVATDGTGIAKFFFDGTSWQAAGTTQVLGSSSIFGLSGSVDPNSGNVDLFVTTGDGTAGTGTGPGGATELVSFVDTSTFSGNISGTSTAIATAGSGFTFKGLDLAPQVTPAPEPGTMILGSVAALGMAGARYLRRRKAVEAIA